jgi:hypothetical protein
MRDNRKEGRAGNILVRGFRVLFSSRLDQLLGCHFGRDNPHESVAYRLHFRRVHDPHSLQPPELA